MQTRMPLGAADDRRPVAADRAPSANHVRSVTEANQEARLLLERQFRLVWIEGEVSNFRRYPSGHWYFSLKDARSQLGCVMFASRSRFVRARIRDGMAVVVRGQLSIYAEQGKFQAIVDHIEPAGEGALQAAYEELKARLSREGLFDADAKLPIPPYPRHIAVISSEKAAALADVLAVMGRRFPCVRVTCFFAAMQGFEAVGQIIGAFDRAERMRSTPDVIIVTRGGGSPEDLATFNDEALARRIAAARIPVIAAIGHEIDVTIADFVADRRAPTPSAAAELATPDGRALFQRFARLRSTIANLAAMRLGTDRRLFASVRNRLVHPGRAVQQRMQRADELADRLDSAMRGRLGRARTTLEYHQALLRRSNPGVRIDNAARQVARVQDRLRTATKSRLDAAVSRAGSLARALRAVSPLATLDRGYAIVASPDGGRWGRPLKSATEAKPGQTLVAHLKDGRLAVEVTGTDP